MRILSGITPSGSGNLHLGNYFGAIQQFLSLQEQGHEVFIFVADYHALTALSDAAQLQKNIYATVAAYLALGLDPERITLYRQSALHGIPELAWYLSCIAPMGLLERAHAYKDKTAKGMAASVGLFTYPILMAADILIVRPDAVPVGKDQKQHVEITRDLAEKMNSTYGTTLPLPEPRIPEEVAVIPGTDGEKMSKSYGNTVDLFSPDSVVQKQIQGIQTASTPLGAPLNPDTCTVFRLYSLLDSAGADTAELRAAYLGGLIGYGEAKKRLLAKFHTVFDAARLRYNTLITDFDALDAVLARGAQKAVAEAECTMQDIRSKVGITRSI